MVHTLQPTKLTTCDAIVESANKRRVNLPRAAAPDAAASTAPSPDLT
jgi:hypothetical protein